MKTKRWLAIFLAMTWLMTVRAVDRYVSLDGTNDAAGGYTNWAGAATSVIDAVTAASVSETIWMSNGVFSLTNFMTIDNSKTLRSVNGRDWTIINGLADGWGTAATMGNHIFVNSATFDGITMSNGYCMGAYDALYDYHAGGIKCNNGNILNSKITHCTSQGRGAGGVIFYATASIMTNCIVQNNYGQDHGSGVWIINDGSTIKNCTIQNNFSTFLGAGVSCYFSGAPSANRTSPVLANCIIRNNTNTSGYVGIGGISLIQAGIVRNCLITGNRTTLGGGGIHVENVKYYNNNNAEIDNCTIVDNVSTEGGGIRVVGAQNTNAIINCIVYSNFADLAHSTPNDVVLVDPVSTNAFLYSRLTNNIPSDRHCITGDPLFVDCAGGNYRLQANSPGINAGTNQDWMTNSVDLDERTRIRYGTVDMGAYEHIQSGTVFSFH